jgi:hypothetical protein
MRIPSFARGFSQATNSANELLGLSEVSTEAVTRGPLYAMRRVAKGEIGGPILRLIITIYSVLGVPTALLGTVWGARVVAVAAPILVVALGLGLAYVAVQGEVWLQILAGLIAIGYLGPPSWALYNVALRRTRAAFTSRFSRWSLEDLLLFGGAVVAMPATGFAIVASILVKNGLITISGGDPGDSLLPLWCLEIFGWAFADAVPILKIPETLDWTPHLAFTNLLGGLLVLAFKCLQIIPIAQLLSEVIKRVFGEEDEAAKRDDAVPGSGAGGPAAASGTPPTA